MIKKHIEGEDFNREDYTVRGLPYADYENCTFTGCNFSETDLAEVKFIECTFEGCDLSMAKLKGTAFQEVDFKTCKLLGLRFDECKDFLLSFRFEGCILSYASFYKLKLKNTHFVDCKLEQVEFVETDLSNAVFQHCDLSLAVFERTILEGADLKTAYNFSIDPENNRIKKAKFSVQNIVGLLDKYGIVVE